MSNQVQVSIAVPGADDEEVAAVSRALATWIDDAAPGCAANPWTQSGPEGGKGLMEVLGTLGVSILDHGAISSLANCLSVFINERRREINITLKSPSGGSVELRAGGIGPKEMDELVLRLGAMVRPEARAST